MTETEDMKEAYRRVRARLTAAQIANMHLEQLIAEVRKELEKMAAESGSSRKE